MKLAIFDKDGTLTTPKNGAKFVQHPQDQMLLPGVADGIAALAADGWKIAIASNQGGVAAGHKSLEDVIAEMRFCLKLLPEVDVAYFCPDFDGDELWAVKQSKPGSGDAGVIDRNGTYNYRKPSPGMILWAGQLYSEVFFVGDRPEDEQSAAAAGVPFQWADEWRATYAQS